MWLAEPDNVIHIEWDWLGEDHHDFLRVPGYMRPGIFMPPVRTLILSSAIA